MAHLTKPTQYKIEDSNIALLGSDLEKRVREHAGDTEPAWEKAGTTVGIQAWRIEQFHVKSWTRLGEFFDGDSYIVLNTYKKDPNSDVLSYDLHFWLGEETTQDEAGTAAYKTVELDDHLRGVPVEYREVQGYESPRFISYFPKLLILHGGTASGFRYVTEPPPLKLFNFYHISASKPLPTGASKPPTLIVRQVTNGYKKALKQYPNDVFVLDKGRDIWQWNSKKSSGKERFKAAEFCRSIVDSRKHEPVLKVFDEGASGASNFVIELGEEHAHTSNIEQSEAESEADSPLDTPASAVASPILYRLSDASGQVEFTQVVDLQGAGPSPTLSDFDSSDAFILDDSRSTYAPAVYAWIGQQTSVVERKYAVQYAQQYLWRESGTGHGGGKKRSSTNIVRLVQGNESSQFLRVVGARA